MIIALIKEMKKIFLTVVCVTGIAFVSCKKSTATQVANPPSSNNPYVPPTYVAGNFEISKFTNIQLDGSTAYSYTTSASFTDGNNNISSEGIVKVDGIAFNLSGHNYNSTTQNTQAPDTTNWSISSYTCMQNGLVVKDSNINVRINPQGNIYTPVFIDTMRFNVNYKMKLPMTIYAFNSYYSVNVELNGFTDHITVNTTRDSIIFGYQVISEAAYAENLPTAVKSFPLQFSIIGTNYKDTLIGNRKYHFKTNNIISSNVYFSRN